MSPFRIAAALGALFLAVQGYEWLRLISFGLTTASGVYGGTFDPVHIGHMAVAVNVRHVLQLDQLLMVVANVPWQKAGGREVSPAEDRLAMVEAAVDGLSGVEASSIELDRVLAGHHLVALAVHHQHRLVDACEVRRPLLTPSVNGLQLGAERAHGYGFVTCSTKSARRDHAHRASPTRGGG